MKIWEKEKKYLPNVLPEAKNSRKTGKNASLPKIIHNGNFSSQINVFFYSSAFKSKTEKIENFSENSKKSLKHNIQSVCFQSLVWCEDCKPILQQSNKMLQIRHWIFVLVFFLFFCSKSTLKKVDNGSVKFIWLFNVK